MTTIRAKIFDVFRNLKSDAVPQAPRAKESEKQDSDSDVTDTHEEHNNEEYVEQDEEEIVINLEGFSGTENAKNKSYGSSKKKEDIPKSEKKKKTHTDYNNVNTHASGNVINIVGSRNLHFGNEFTYYLGSTTMPGSQQQRTQDPEDLKIKKCNLITLVLEAKIKPEYEYIEYISKNLGKNWYSFFRFLGYSQGRIETYEIDEAKNGGVSEARYKLLLDWQRNDEDGTLGCLTTKLWQHGERQIVKELALIYNNNHKKL